MLPLLLLFIILLLMVLVSIAFVTLMERKLLGYMQLRKGPNKISLNGLLQPMADGIKLFLKEDSGNMNVNYYLFNFFPSLAFILMLMLWLLYSFVFMNLINLNVILFMLISGSGVYSILGMGWSSNSKYALLGAYRGVAQTISYEVTMVFILVIMVMLSKSYNLKKVMFMKDTMVWYIFGFIGMFVIWGMVLVAELNRAPFDFAEGESELVSGFNVEYGSGKFALIFLAEYGNIIFMSYITMEFFMYNSYMLYTVLLVILVIWMRGTYVRYRYDNLMYLNWKSFLPFVLSFFLLFMMYIHV